MSLIHETRKNIAFLKERQKEVANELDVFYQRTLDMLDAIELGKDRDTCLSYWAEIISEMSNEDFGPTGYFNAHATNLVHMIDTLIKELNANDNQANTRPT